MDDVNKIIVTGRIGNYPSSYTSPNGAYLVKFPIAINSYSRKEKKMKTIWVECVFFGGSGTYIEQHMTKGDKILVVGRLNVSEWTDSSGGKHYRAQIIGESFSSMEFRGKGKKNKGDVNDETEDDVDAISGDDTGSTEEENTDMEIPF